MILKVVLWSPVDKNLTTHRLIMGFVFNYEVVKILVIIIENYFIAQHKDM